MAAFFQGGIEDLMRGLVHWTVTPIMASLVSTSYRFDHRYRWVDQLASQYELVGPGYFRKALQNCTVVPAIDCKTLCKADDLTWERLGPFDVPIGGVVLSVSDALLAHFEVEPTNPNGDDFTIRWGGAVMMIGGDSVVQSPHTILDLSSIVKANVRVIVRPTCWSRLLEPEI